MGILIIAAFLASGCGPDLPDGIYAESENPAFGLPDTVSVSVMGSFHGMGEPTRWERTDPVRRAWLQEHGYVRIRTTLSEPSAVDSMLEAEGFESIEMGDGGVMTHGDRIYVRVPE